MPAEQWLITGAAGQLGGHLVRQLTDDPDRPAIHAWARAAASPAASSNAAEPADQPLDRPQPVDLADPDQLRRALYGCTPRPRFILHAAALTSLAECYRAPDAARRVNVDATRILAEAAADLRARLVFISTDMVFDGVHAPYAESDRPAPLSVYGRSKLEAERAVAELPNTLIVRVPLMYGRPATARNTTFTEQIAALQSGRALSLFVDEFRTPLALRDAARALVALARSGRTGLIHLAGPERLSRFQMIARAAELLGLDHPRLEPVSRLAFDAPEPRPADLSLDGRQFLDEFPDFAPRPMQRADLET